MKENTERNVKVHDYLRHIYPHQALWINKLEKTGAQITDREGFGGVNPVQIYGDLSEGVHFYFRARDGEVGLSVTHTPLGNAVSVRRYEGSDNPDGVWINLRPEYCEIYPVGMMPLNEAIRLTIIGIDEYRERMSLISGRGISFYDPKSLK